MNNYELAKIISMANGIDSRKRIQKTVHLLQMTGSDFGLDFRLHHYGPYSFELADLLDRMTGSGILTETEESTAVGTQYNYSLNPEFATRFEQYETTSRGEKAKNVLEARQELLVKLNHVAPRTLELTSTIAEFRRRNKSWTDATKRAAKFKGEKPKSTAMVEARKLAEELVGIPDGED